jgi:hypothetical protein
MFARANGYFAFSFSFLCFACPVLGFQMLLSSRESQSVSSYDTWFSPLHVFAQLNVKCSNNQMSFA